MLKKIANSFLLLSICFACSKGKEDVSTITPPVPLPIVQQDTLPKVEWSKIISSLDSLENKFSQSLTLNTLINLEALSNESSVTLTSVVEQLKIHPNTTPYFSNYPLSLNYQSKYDHYKFTYTLEAPEKNVEAPLVIILSAFESSPSKLENKNVWRLYLPSRPHLNYQLLAEGDFWGILQDIYQYYPFLEKQKHFLIGSNEAADSALVFANAYPERFHGVAVSGAKFLWDMPNLDNMPIVTFHAPITRPHLPWNSKHFIQRIKSRGNTTAQVIEGSLDKAFAVLENTPRNNSSLKYSFFDYQYAKLNPWLTITNKTSDFDQVHLIAEKDGSKLKLSSQNVYNLQLKTKEVESLGFESISFNDQQISFSKSDTSINLGPTFTNSYYRKVDAPGGYINFFRNEPLYIVYQDEEAPPRYIEKAKNLASRIALFDLRGLPKAPVDLPLMGSREYISKSLPKHRAIFIGRSNYLWIFTSIEKDQFPLNWDDEHLILQNRILTNFSSPPEELIFALNFPSKSIASLSLAFLLGGNTLEGLEKLESFYCNATSLFDPFDVRIWSKEKEGYKLLSETMFNGFWEPTQEPVALIHLPEQEREIWKEVLHEILVQHTGSPYFILSPLLYPSNVPSKLNVSSLKKFIANKHFALISLRGQDGFNLGSKILKQTNQPDIFGLNRFLQFDESTQSFVFKTEMFKKSEGLRLVVEMDTLNTLSRSDLKALDVELIPYSLHELLFDWVRTKPKKFANLFLQSNEESTPYFVR